MQNPKEWIYNGKLCRWKQEKCLLFTPGSELIILATHSAIPAAALPKEAELLPSVASGCSLYEVEVQNLEVKRNKRPNQWVSQPKALHVLGEQKM